MTIGQLNTETTTDASKGKEPRLHKETNLEMLKRIARNSEKGDAMPCMQNVKTKEFVENVRDPGKFTMETFAREYGDVPK